MITICICCLVVGGIAMLSAVPTLAQWFLQIVNLKANHWDTVSNLRCQVGTVKVYDSSGHDTTPDFLSQLTSIIFSRQGLLWLWSGRQSSSRKGAQIVLCLLLQTVLLSAEMRNVPWHDTIRNPLQIIYSLVFRLGAWNHFPVPNSSPCPGSRTPKVSTPYTTEVSVHCFCWKYVGEGKEVARYRKHVHVSCLFHVVNVHEFVCPSHVFPTLVFTAWPVLHLKTVGILLHYI